MLAEERNAMRGKLDKLVPMIDKMDINWVADWTDDTQEKYFVSLLHDVNVCFITADRTRQRIGAIYMSEKTAVYIKEQINKSLKLEIKDGNGKIVVSR